MIGVSVLPALLALSIVGGLMSAIIVPCLIGLVILPARAARRAAARSVETFPKVS